MQLASGILYLFAIVIAIEPSFSRGSVAVSGVHDDAFDSENDSVSSSMMNDIGKSLEYHDTKEFFDPQKKIIAHKNEATGECVLELLDNRADIFNNNDNKYDTNSELSEDGVRNMIEIVGEKIIAFCNGKSIILNNFDNTDKYRRSKRSTDNKKRYHGQTQTQFISFGSKNSDQETKNGLAEALSQPDLTRATVSGINGMGQAQSQSSFGDCDDCSGQDYKPHPSRGDNSFPGNFPSSPSLGSIPQNTFSRPYGGSDMNRQSPDSQYRGNNEGPSINGQFLDSGMNGKGPTKDQRYGIGPKEDEHYPSTYNRVPDKLDQGYGTGSTVNDKYPTDYPSSGTNDRNPGNQNQAYGSGPSVDGNYPSTYNRVPSKLDQGYSTGSTVGSKYPTDYPSSGTNGRSQGNQNQAYGSGPSVDGNYPSTYNRVPNKLDQGYSTGSTVGGKYPTDYPSSGTNGRTQGNQNQAYGPSVDGQYPGTYNRMPSKIDQGFGSGLPVDSQYPSTYNVPPSKQDQGYGSGQKVNEYLGTNNKLPGTQDQQYSTGPVNGQYPGTYNRIPIKPNQGYGSGLSVNGQYPSTHPDSGSINRVPLKQDQGDQNSFNKLAPNLIYTHLEEPKKVGNTNLVNQNTYPLDSNSFNSNSWNSPTMVNNNPINHPSYPDGSGSHNFPSGSAQGILVPQNTLNNNVKLTYPNNSPQFTFPNSQEVPIKPITDPLNFQNEQKIEKGSVGMPYIPQTHQNTYQNVPWNTQGGQGFTQLNLPSSCNFLYQTCLNALSNNRKPNELQLGGINVLTIQQSAYPSYYENLNTNQQSYGQPQGSINSEGSSAQQPGYSSIRGNDNLNQVHPSYGQPQSSIGTVGSRSQQAGYSTSGEQQPQGSLNIIGSGNKQPSYNPNRGNINPNQGQPSYGQPQGLSGIGVSSDLQPGYAPSSGNVYPNQIQHNNYGQHQGSLGIGESGVKQPGYDLNRGNLNINQVQFGYRQPQSSLGIGVSGTQQSGYSPSDREQHQGSGRTGSQQPGYISSTGSLYPNQIQHNYGQSNGALDTGLSSVQQSGYVPPDGNVNQNKPSYGQSQSSFRPEVPGTQQPGTSLINGNNNQDQSSFKQPQGFDQKDSSVLQPDYTSSTVNVNPNQIQPINGQPQGSFGPVGSSIQQPGYASSGGNVQPNQIQPNYRQPQDSFGTRESTAPKPGNVPSGEILNPNQIQPSYGKHQPTYNQGEFGIQQPGYAQPVGNINLNEGQPRYGQPQNPIGSDRSGFQQSSYAPSSAAVNPNIPSSFQPDLDGKRVPGNFNQPNSGDDYKGQPLKPETHVGNNYPIVGGQFGTDISSGDSVIPIDTEGGNTQSMTNVNVDGQETSASASSQGKSKSGMTQTQVSGTYSGTGTFSAQAQTSDSDKGAQSQIVSNTNGTTSTAQGRGGKGQAQSQVIYNSESGITLGESQSSGINYGTNTQLQAGIKGGLADAQSTGPGSTSSQAQIGFLPYESNTNQKSLFRGGGTASSQSGQHNGQSQSQLFGSYKHGITYNGAAQASSGKKLQNLPKLNLDEAKLKIGQLGGSNNVSKNQTELQPQQPIDDKNVLKSQSTTKESIKDNNSQQTNTNQSILSIQTPSTVLPQLSRNFEIDDEYDDNDEYEDDKEETINTKSGQIIKDTNPKQEQNIILNLGDKHDAQITRDSDSQLKTGQILDAGQIIPGTNGTIIPDGFRGRVASTAGDHTEAKATPGGHAQSQTVLLTPGAGGLTVVDKTKFKALLSKESHINPANKQYNGFQTNVNGQTGKFKPDDKSVQYFTKSSICGYFSFSCNYINGTNGPKICKPNPSPLPCQKSNQ